MTTSRTRTTGLLDRLFELRALTAVLFAIYGVVCLVCGIAFTSAADLQKAGGVNVNLFAGIGMLVVAAAFAAWAWRRPVVPEEHETPAE